MGKAQRCCAEPVPFRGDDTSDDDGEMGWVKHSNAALNPSPFHGDDTSDGDGEMGWVQHSDAALNPSHFTATTRATVTVRWDGYSTATLR